MQYPYGNPSLLLVLQLYLKPHKTAIHPCNSYLKPHKCFPKVRSIPSRSTGYTIRQTRYYSEHEERAQPPTYTPRHQQSLHSIRVTFYFFRLYIFIFSSRIFFRRYDTFGTFYPFPGHPQPLGPACLVRHPPLHHAWKPIKSTAVPCSTNHPSRVYLSPFPSRSSLLNFGTPPFLSARNCSRQVSAEMRPAEAAARLRSRSAKRRRRNA